MLNNTNNLPDNLQVAFFDLDETITSRETDQLWALWRCKRSLSGLGDLLRLNRINRLYYSHALEPEDYKNYHLSRARSMTPGEYRRSAERFASYAVKRYIYSDMKELLKNNRDRGIKNILITAQDEIIAEAFHRKLDMDGCLASRYITKGDEFCGMVLPLCFKEGKVYWAGQFLREHSLRWEDSAFFTDSMNDLPLLEVCGYPVAVHPSPELEELCHNRSWPIVRPN